MSVAVSPIDSRDASHAPDGIVSGLSWMLAINVMQRAIGFVRNIALCYFLSEAHLGLWGLVSCFFGLAAPLAVLGLPGTFGRFVAGYQSRGQLVRYLGFSMALAAIGYAILGTILVVFHGASGMTILGEPRSRLDMLLLAAALGCIILFNASTELITGLRLPKKASWMHAVNSLAFTLLSVIGLVGFRDWRVLVAAFAVSALLGMVPAIPVLLQRGMWHGSTREPIAWRELARRVLPFAASVWTMNLALNTFDVVDRYMLLHWSQEGTTSVDAQALVGQLHSGKLIPTLLSNMAVMLAGIVLPYLVADWEQGRVDRVVSSLRTTVKLGSLFFLILSLGALVAAPFLFTWVLQGRYAEGLAILPKALTACCWMSISLFLSNYFWCAERGRLLGAITTAGLIANIGLCLWWIPSTGLHGAMNANVAASGLLLTLMILALKQWKIALDTSTFLIVASPLVLMLGTVPAAFLLGAMIIAVSRTSWLLSPEEKHGIDAFVVPRLRQFGWNITTIWAR